MIMELLDLIKKLVKLGEDKDELDLWLRLFPDLEPAEQKKLLKNLQDELQQLESIKNNS